MLKAPLFSIIMILAAAAGTTARAQGAGAYTDARSFFGGPGQASMSPGEFGASVAALGDQFARICGDTFCAGDISDFTSVAFDCSIEVQTGVVGECAWTFAGTTSTIDGATGKVTVQRQLFSCPVAVKGDAAALATFLRSAATEGATGVDGLQHVAIPGSTLSLYSALLSCL